MQSSEEINQTYITMNDLPVRSGPGDQFQVLTEIPAETKVTITGHEGEWLRVISKRGNPSGYIDKRFVRPLTESITEAETTATESQQ